MPDAVVTPLPRADIRPSGLPVMHGVPWGTHICQFYRTRQDLLETLVPYFKAGLEANERCVWVAAEPLDALDARRALAEALDDLEDRETRGQIEIVDYREWYVRSGRLGPDELLRNWLETESAARAAGYAGLRVSGNTSWLSPNDWDGFSAYEASVHRAFRRRRMIALCSYTLDRCGSSEVFDVLREHGFALLRRDGRWEVLQSATLTLVAGAMGASDGNGATSSPRPPAGPPGGTPGGSSAGHVARFFDEGLYPAARIAAFLHAGLVDDGAAMAFATPEHLEAIAAALVPLGVNVPTSVAAGRLVTVDAHKLRASLMTGGTLGLESFDDQVVTLVNQMLARHGRVRIYGEVVDLLARAGDVEAALELEAWWNVFVREKPIDLLCGYSMTSFANAKAVEPFRRVSDEHRDVEPPADDPDRTRARVVAELHQTTLALEVEAKERDLLEQQRDWFRDAERVARSRAQAAAEQLSRLQRVTSALSDVSSVLQIADIVSGDIPEVLGAQTAVLVVPTEDRTSLLAVRGATGDVDDRAWLPAVPVDSRLPVAEVFRSGRAAWVTAVEDGERHTVALVPAPRSVGCLPVLLGGERLGVIELTFSAPYEPPASERVLLDDYVKQIAAALDRVRSYDDAQRARARLQLIADAAGRISRAKLDLRRVLDTVVQEVTGAGFAECCVIHLATEDRSSFPLAALHHVDPTLRAEVQETLQRHPVEAGFGLTGRVARTGQAVRVGGPEDIFDASDPRYRPYLERSPLAAVLIVPLRASGEVIGTLSASRGPLAPPYTANDQQILQDLADRAALSVENALLYERAQKERERAEQERQRAELERRRAESASRSKDEFLAMLGHELRNPLSPILTAVQLMRLRSRDAPPREWTIIERQVNHMARLVDDLLDVSRIARGKVELRRMPVELGHVVTTAIEIASPVLEARAHRLVSNVPAVGLVVEADPDRLGQVVVNLLTNAAKYTAIGGLVEVGVSVTDGIAALSVRDSGVGIEPSLLPRVFDLFTQGRQASDRAQGGLGLGLAIARNLMEMHGGSLRAESEGLGKGSTFTLALPLLGQPVGPARIDAKLPVERTAGGALRVLVVDDNTDAAVALGEALESIGHDVRLAYDGPSALQVAAEFGPELAMLDIGLPVMDGYELAQRLLAASGSGRPRLVAVTGYGQESDRHRSTAAGFDEHLVKPLDFERLEAVIRRLFAPTDTTRARVQR